MSQVGGWGWNGRILTSMDFLTFPLVFERFLTFSEKYFTDLVKKVGFSSWYRVARKTKYYNIRKIFSPFYYDYNHPLAKLFYGDGGALNFIITK